MTANRNRVTILAMALISMASSTTGVLRGRNSALSTLEGDMLAQEKDEKDPLAPRRMLQEQVQCTDFASVSPGLLNHELSDSTCFENNCSGGCCRLYKWLICDRENAFPDIPCVCNEITQEKVDEEETESISVPSSPEAPLLAGDNINTTMEQAVPPSNSSMIHSLDNIEFSANLVVLKTVNQSDAGSNNTEEDVFDDEADYQGEPIEVEEADDTTASPSTGVPMTMAPTLVPTNNPTTDMPTMTPTSPQTRLRLTLAPTQEAPPTTTSTIVDGSVIESALEEMPQDDSTITACSGGSWYHDNTNFISFRKCVHNSDCRQLEDDECCLKDFCFCGSALGGHRDSLCV